MTTPLVAPWNSLRVLQCRLGAETRITRERARHLGFGMHLRVGPGELDRFAAFSGNLFFVTLPYRYSQYLVQIARSQHVNCTDAFKEGSLFPLQGGTVKCTTSQFVRILDEMDRKHDLRSTQVHAAARYCFVPIALVKSCPQPTQVSIHFHSNWGSLSLVPSGTPGATEHPLLLRYGKAMAPATDGPWEVIRLAASSPPQIVAQPGGAPPLRLECSSVFDVRFSATLGGSSLNILLYRSSTAVIRHLRSLCVFQSLAQLARHIEAGGSADEAPAVCEKAEKQAGGGVIQRLYKGANSKDGNPKWRASNPPGSLVAVLVTVYGKLAQSAIRSKLLLHMCRHIKQPAGFSLRRVPWSPIRRPDSRVPWSVTQRRC